MSISAERPAHAPWRGDSVARSVADAERRLLALRLAGQWRGAPCRRMAGGGLPLENVYVPAGGDIPDPAVNPKFAQKLAFVERMTDWAKCLDEPTLIVGDFNIAPLPEDVWSHKQLLDVVSHTPVEVDALDRLKAAHDWVDLGRHFYPAPARLHTWWSYRSPDWTVNDRGRRLDHMWASKAVAAKAVAHRVHEDCRNLAQAERPCAARDRVRGVTNPADAARGDRRAPARVAGARSGGEWHADRNRGRAPRTMRGWRRSIRTGRPNCCCPPSAARSSSSPISAMRRRGPARFDRARAVARSAPPRSRSPIRPTISRPRSRGRIARVPWRKARRRRRR